MRLSRPALVFLVLAWVLVALYPDPGMLVRAVINISEARADPAAAASRAAALPGDPQQVEAAVLATPYAYDWQTWGVPWYFPSADEALRAPQGDCESRALVLASLLTAKGIPNELRVALNHIWVEYPGKRATLLENSAIEIAGHRDGRFFLKLPGDFDLGQAVSDQIEITWAPMPLWRLLVLLTGLLLIPFANLWAGRLAGVAGDGPGPRLLPPSPPAGRRRRRGAQAAATRMAPARKVT
jgi:hypothetical protein